MTTLSELANKYGSDKGTQFHCYTEIYPAYLDVFKAKEDFRLLEIGVKHGASMRMWAEYFPLGEIEGWDTDALPLVSEDNVVMRRQDATQATSWLEESGTFDVIVDDGSHKQSDIVAAFELGFYKHLRDGGIYIIEDAYPYPAWVVRGTMQRLFLELLDELSDNGATGCGNPTKDNGPIAFVHFYKHLIVVKKKDALPNESTTNQPNECQIQS